MASRRDWRHVTATSATLSAGALVFFAMGTSPASAGTQPAASASGCTLGKLLCGVLGQGGSATPSSPPKSGGGTTASTPPAKPKPQPKPADRPAPAHRGSTGSARGAGGAAPAIPPAAGAPSYPVPQSAQAPQLPDVSDQDPLVVPGAAPGGPSSKRLVADSAPQGETIPPLLVATASGLIGAIAALNISVLRRRREGLQ